MEALRETTRRMNTFTITVPQGSQSAFLRTMSRNMGWTIKPMPRKRKTGLELAMEDVKAGRLYSFDNVEDAIKWLND